MPRNALRLTALAAALFAAPILFAGGPADLLDQAVRENEAKTAAKPAENPEIDRLLAEANRLSDAREFAEAVTLYEKAYRLDPNNRAMYARLLVAKRSAGTLTDQDQEALALIEEEVAAEVAQVYRGVRLQIIQARQALRSGDLELARERIASATGALDRLPQHVDTSPYRRELASLSEGLIRRTSRAAKAEKSLANGSNAVVTRRANQTDPTLMDTGEVTTVESATVASRTHGDRGTYEFVETGEIIDIDDALYCDQAIHAYERELARCLARQRSTHFIDNQVAAFPLPAGVDMVYPADWCEKTARRAEYRDGVIHEGAPYTGADGQTYQTVVYDLAELVHPVPNFYAAYPGTVREQRMQSLDRQYIRERSMIFNGWPEDLAAGLPLLHFFGGIDNNAVSTQTDPYETDRIMAILDRFVNNQNAPAPATQQDPQ